MARSAQTAVPADGVAHKIFPPTGTDPDVAYGNTACLYNAGSVTIELGGSDVTTGTGFRGLVPNATLVIDLAEGESLYGLVPSGSVAGAVDVLGVR